MAVIEDLSNICFFDDRGFEVPVQKVYNCIWTPKFNAKNGIVTNEAADGYLIGSLYTTDFNFKVLNNGRFVILDYDNAVDRLNAEAKAAYDKDKTLADSLSEYQKIVREKFVSESLTKSLQALTLQVTITVQTGSDVVKTIDMTSTAVLSDVSTYNFTAQELDYYSTSDTAVPTYYEYMLSDVSIASAAYSAFCAYIENELYSTTNASSLTSTYGLGSLYPYFSVIGSLDQEKVSAGLVSATTIFSLFDTADGNGVESYPDYDCSIFFYIDSSADSSGFSMMTNTEPSSTIETTYQKEVSFKYVKTETSLPVPVAVTVQFDNAEEGVYQNILQMYIKDNASKLYFFGSFYVNSTVVDEDERYRAFFSDFGIPDPVNYSNLFKEQDPEDEGLDYMLINKKSKELYLTYDQIFPYAGTYKALINAVRYLGYEDIVFKEWYKVIDQDRSSRDVAVQIIDISTGETLKSKLKSAGVSYEDFLNYKKLNKLSMLYLLNVESEDYDIQNVTEKTFTYNSLGNLESSAYVQTKKRVSIPSIVKNYDYDNDLIVVKLHAVKRWLERYVIGINCNISDITGEGVYFARMKNLAYSTGYYTMDYQNEAPLTSYVIDVSGYNVLKDSSAKVRCSLYEFNNLKFSDYTDVQIKDFIHKVAKIDRNTDSLTVYTDEETIDNYQPSSKAIDNYIPISNPLSALFLQNEFAFNLQHEDYTTSFYEQAADKTNPLLLKENELYVYDRAKDTTKFDNAQLPTLTLSCANIRRDFGDWHSNIEWTIKPVLDQSTGLTYYQIKNVGRWKSSADTLKSLSYITLKPKKVKIDSSTVKNSDKAYLEYTKGTKWDTPMLRFSGYYIDLDLSKFMDSSMVQYPEYVQSFRDEFDISADNWIIEIVSGDLRFNSTNVPVIGVDSSYVFGETLNTDLRFDLYYPQNIDTDQYEQSIIAYHNYTTGRTPFYQLAVDSSTKSVLVLNLVDNLNKGLQTMKSKSQLGYEIAKSYIMHYSLLRWTLGMDQDYAGMTDAEFINQVYKATGQSMDKIVWTDQTDVYEFGKALVVNAARFDTSTYSADTDLIEFLFYWTDSTECKFIKDLNLSYVHAVNQVYKNAYEKYCSDLRDLYNFKVNDYIDLTVNRIGNYTVNAISYDRHNNIFTDQSSKMASVVAYGPTLDIYTNTENSGNSSDFYKSNIRGELMAQVSQTQKTQYVYGFDKSGARTLVKTVNMVVDSSDYSLVTDEILSRCDDRPKFPEAYRITGLTPIDSSTIYYDALSYSVDTPKQNDYMILSNLTERVVDTSIETDEKNVERVTLSLVDENPRVQELFIDGIWINLYAYNPVTLSVEETFGPLKVFSTFKQDTSLDINYGADSWLKIWPYVKNIIDSSFYVDFKKIQAKIDDKSWKIYAGNITEFTVDTSAYNSSTELKSYVQISIDSSLPIFRSNDVVKLIYYEETTNQVNDTDIFDYPSFKTTSYYAQTGYRVLDSSIVLASDSSKYVHTYVLNGYLNAGLLGTETFNNRSGSKNAVKLKIAFANQDYVEYPLRATQDAVEALNTSPLNKTMFIGTTLHYSSDDWLSDEYIDCTYSGIVLDYNPAEVLRDWADSSSLNWGPDTELFRYRDFPVTLHIGNNVIVSSEDTYGTFWKSYKSSWKVSVEQLDFADQREHNQTVYRAVNNCLSLKPSLKGTHRIELKAMDIFGNQTVTEKDGLLYVKEVS